MRIYVHYNIIILRATGKGPSRTLFPRLPLYYTPTVHSVHYALGNNAQKTFCSHSSCFVCNGHSNARIKSASEGDDGGGESRKAYRKK